VALTTHCHLASRLKSRAIPLLLCTVMAYSRVNFTFTCPHYDIHTALNCVEASFEPMVLSLLLIYYDKQHCMC